MVAGGGLSGNGGDGAMDWKRLRTLVAKLHIAAYQEGLNEGRRDVSKEIAQHVQAELLFFIDESEKESKKDIVVEMPPLPPPPPSERRCRNCGWFVTWPEGREVAKSGKCFAHNVGTEWADALEDLDHSWCTRWKPMEEEKKEPVPSPSPSAETPRKYGFKRVCRNCKLLTKDPRYGSFGENEGICMHGHEMIFNTDEHECNLFDPTLTALTMEVNRHIENRELAMAAAGTAGTAETAGPLTPKPVRCAECKHGEISVNEGTATCKKSGMVFEDYSKFVPCGEFEPKKKDEEPEEAKTCGDCKHMGACMATSSRELGQPPPEHAVCELFESKEKDEEPKEPEEDKRCGNCVCYNARNLWCEGHGIPVVASSGACPDYRKEEKK